MLKASHPTRRWGVTPCRLVISRTQQERGGTGRVGQGRATARETGKHKRQRSENVVGLRRTTTATVKKQTAKKVIKSVYRSHRLK